MMIIVVIMCYYDNVNYYNNPLKGHVFTIPKRSLWITRLMMMMMMMVMMMMMMMMTGQPHPPFLFETAKSHIDHLLATHGTTGDVVQDVCPNGPNHCPKEIMVPTSTVDGWNPVNSPVEVASLSHCFWGFSTIPGGCLGFQPSTVVFESPSGHLKLARIFRDAMRFIDLFTKKIPYFHKNQGAKKNFSAFSTGDFCLSTYTTTSVSWHPCKAPFSTQPLFIFCCSFACQWRKLSSGCSFAHSQALPSSILSHLFNQIPC